VASMAWSLGVPRELVPICEDRGNYYCVEEDGTVLLWEGETGELNEDETWESVWHWVRDIWLES
jgi:hypothetical protein